MANHRLRSLTWWRNWAKRDWAIVAFGFTFIVFLLAQFFDSRTEVVSNTGDLVDLTLLSNAKERGALCLDGSLPGYHFKKGFGSGSSNWVLHIEGGGWCNTIASCAQRKATPLGSSNYMERRVLFSGILSSDLFQNPDFFNWNKVKIRYCDGASFAGHPERELKERKLFFRGQLIWEALMDELLSIGLSNAKQALLSGCSAGGLATLIHCDDFRDRLPKDTTVKCLADAGFFLDEPDVLGNRTMKSFYHDVVHLQLSINRRFYMIMKFSISLKSCYSNATSVLVMGVAKSLPKNCVAKMEPSQCLFPQEIIKNVRTPVFIVNPAYDFWQIQHVLVPDVSDPDHYWRRCRLNLDKCNSTQMEILQGFRSSLLKALNEFQTSKGGGIFINSCFIHCQTWVTETWHSPHSPKINNKTIAESVGDWYFNRKVAKQLDCAYPCNPTCYNMDFTRG